MNDDQQVQGGGREVVDWEAESEGVVVSGDLGASPQALKLSMDELGTALVTIEDDQVEYALMGGTVNPSGCVTVGVCMCRGGGAEL